MIEKPVRCQEELVRRLPPQFGLTCPSDAPLSIDEIAHLIATEYGDAMRLLGAL
jgi:hypothetical protein